ncbi:MAG: 16S rRNA (adenine(1518)-N(6)/adenine(1519)-N(6))-dimethyltransferase RsmA [Bacteroidales bacterium]|jgi:16S rRNA (adenine1518-N6/adenine1519-N6)-dimethyltransferase|nr:16S rRNA (adenine(1518)-N(6)/adenine(1519)-N(6))-dimethyltransferase RsmA [Bacteroidales bacterium]
MGAGKVTAKKHLGQHFLRDRNIAAAIVDALRAEGCDTVMEVGPGMGVLTRFLAARNFPSLKVVEIDHEAVAYLRANVPGAYEIIEGDFLTLDLRKMGASMAVIGNFPYNISSQLFFRILDERDRVGEVVCMVQKEVADRICSAPGSRVYGILSVLLTAWYDIEYLFTVSENVFSPPPKVKSAVIRLRRNERSRLDCDERLFVTVVKRCFNQRRKMIRNPLKMMVSADAGDMPYLSMRAEQLSVEQFAELTRWVAGNRINAGEASHGGQKE